MDRLEEYLDRVCRRIGGPREMRMHVRQELKGHLQDAAAEHERAGMPREQAMEKALAEFGDVEAVRGELEGAHGQRLVAVAIEKAMDWKEKTMKARWLWLTWAHGALLLVIGLEVTFVCMAAVFILPKYKDLASDGYIHLTLGDAAPLVAWLWSFWCTVEEWAVRQWWWVALGVAIIWGLFEWRVRSENKATMRLAAMGTVSFLLLIVVFLISAAMGLSTALSVGWEERAPERIVLPAWEQWEHAIAQAEATFGKDPVAFGKAASEASRASRQLGARWATGPLVFGTTDAERIRELRQGFREMMSALWRADSAMYLGHRAAAEWEMQKFREIHERMKPTTTMPRN